MCILCVCLVIMPGLLASLHLVLVFCISFLSKSTSTLDFHCWLINRFLFFIFLIFGRGSCLWLRNNVISLTFLTNVEKIKK